MQRAFQFLVDSNAHITRLGDRSKRLSLPSQIYFITVFNFSYHPITVHERTFLNNFPASVTPAKDGCECYEPLQQCFLNRCSTSRDPRASTLAEQYHRQLQQKNPSLGNGLR